MIGLHALMIVLSSLPKISAPAIVENRNARSYNHPTLSE
jgi:hypothetical protein